MFAEIVTLRSADAVESKFIHDVPDTSFSLSWSGGREIEGEYGADIDRRTGLHSSSVTPDQSHHHPFHTRYPLCSCPSLCLACEAAQMPSDSDRLSLGSRPTAMPPSGSEQVGREIFGTRAECGWRATSQRLIDLLQFQKRPPRRLRQTSSARRSHQRKLNC